MKRSIVPLYVGAVTLIRTNLVLVAEGKRAPLIAIGYFTAAQFHDINVVRRGLNLHELISNEIVYIGRHHFTSRNKDGYSIADMVCQIEAALAENAIVLANPRMTATEAILDRNDGYQNEVRDRAIFELTQRKPRAELYSVIPKGDTNSPLNAKGSPLMVSPHGSNPG